MSAIFGFTFHIGRMTEVLTPDIYRAHCVQQAPVGLYYRKRTFIEMKDARTNYECQKKIKILSGKIRKQTNNRIFYCKYSQIMMNAPVIFMAVNKDAIITLEDIDVLADLDTH